MTYDRLNKLPLDPWKASDVEHIEDYLDTLTNEVEGRQKTIFGYYSVNFKQGSVTSTNVSSCCIKDGYLYIGATYIGVMAFRL